MRLVTSRSLRRAARIFDAKDIDIENARYEALRN